MPRTVVAQAGSGTTVVAAAAPGLRHKVISCVLSPAGGGVSTVRFTDGTGNLMGPYRVPGGSASGLVWVGAPGSPFLVETAPNSPLNIVSTGDGYQGVVSFVTEQ